jgi:acyl carrier protein
MPPSSSRASAVIDRLKRLVAQLDVRLGDEPVDETTFLFEGGLGLDSFAVGELIILIEQEFGFEFPESDLTPDAFHDLRTLGAVVSANLEILEGRP